MHPVGPRPSGSLHPDQRPNARSFVYRYLFAKTPRWAGLGPGRPDGIGLAEARTKRDEMRAKILAGVEPGCRALGTQRSQASGSGGRPLHVVERYRLIDGKAAADAQRKHAGAINGFSLDYGRGIIDPDTTKKGLQVEFTVEDPGVFTTLWSGRVTYRRVIGDWPEEGRCGSNCSYARFLSTCESGRQGLPFRLRWQLRCTPDCWRSVASLNSAVEGH
jgi:hypothetical protein